MRLCLPTSVLCLVALTRPAPGAAEGNPPAEPAGIAAFSRHARFVEAKISPKGSYLAVIATEQGKRSLVFFDLVNRKVAATLRPDGEDMVWNFTWANDSRVVAELVASEGHLAAPVRVGELYAADAKTGAGRMVFGYRSGGMQTGSHIRKAVPEYASAGVIGRERGNERQVLIQARSWREAGDPMVQVRRLDVYTGVQELVTVGPIPASRFVVDEAGEVRLAYGRDEAFRFRTYHREPGGSWKELSGAAGSGGRSEPVAVSRKQRLIYFLEEDAGTFRLQAAGIDDARRRLLFETRVAPPRHYELDAGDHRILAAESAPDLPEYAFIDKDHPVGKALLGLLAAHPDDHVRLLDRTDDGRKAVVSVFSDRNPGQFLVVDTEKMEAEPIAEVRPWIRPAEMSEKTAFHIKASDGFPLHGYVTLPRGLSAGQAPPLVVLPHGGPHFVRDHWGFDPEVQLLASQGFAVLQVNYRGSGGYGEAYQEAGFGKWGTRMIEDVVDVTRHAVRKGWADARRICAYGASYGGYAAMQVAIAAPELVRCAVGYAGVYDLRLLGKADDLVGSRLGAGFLRRAIGQDVERLDADSPARNAAKLRAKVLLIHGKEDQRAPLEHAEALRDALAQVGRPPQWHVEPREGHGFYDEQARERMYTRLVAFLKENTTPPLAPAEPPLR